MSRLEPHPTQAAPEGPLPEPPIDGRYQVTRLLGQGSFARTLACQDLAESGRPVAVKELLFDALKEWKPVDLFEREARVLGSLRHAGVPAIYRHFEGRDAQGQLVLYLVMELIDGPSLQDQLRARGSMAELEVTELALGLLDILDYIHGRAPPVFHRDIKPSNVVLRGSGAPVLVDFGGVCQGLRPPQGGSTVTGTFGYMPPEQLLGQVSPASDLYALGATLLHLLTGRAPESFSLDSGRLSLPAEVQVRAGLRRAVDAMLAPAPRDRPASARAARQLLLRTDETTALVPATSSAPAIPSVVHLYAQDGPQPVDVGPPPRDPRGPLLDVYINLVEINRKPIISQRANRRFWRNVGFSAVMGLTGVVSVGVVPGVFLAQRLIRRRRFLPLFRSGTAVTGRLVNVLNIQGYSRLAYEYEVAGRRYRGQMDSAGPLAHHWAAGDPVSVLHDPAEPHRSCVVYRWQEASSQRGNPNVTTTDTRQEQ
jgi:serine/threonine protein kinase